MPCAALVPRPWTPPLHADTLRAVRRSGMEGAGDPKANIVVVVVRIVIVAVGGAQVLWIVVPRTPAHDPSFLRAAEPSLATRLTTKGQTSRL